ncbi:MAG: alpha/beta fold hydrolase [Actinomycetaceae bacterium]|nr:alpha/beta fold hydrolase [Actinomycetaceae bacterium]
MRIHEFGPDKAPKVVLLHVAGARWDYFEYVVALLENDFHVLVPAIPGYDETDPELDFTSVEDIATNLARQLQARGIETIDLLLGCSMGGSIALKMAAEHKVGVRNLVLDGAILPYQLPWLATRAIAVRDFLMVSAGKYAAVTVLEKAFATEQYSREDVEYIKEVLGSMSARTIWRTFESCNNYTLPPRLPHSVGYVEYWYGDREARARRSDIRYLKQVCAQAKIIRIQDRGHCATATFFPQQMAARIRKLVP